MLWLGLTLLLMLVGVVGCVFPGIPGTPLIFAVAVGHRLIVGPAGAPTWVLIVLGVIACLSLALDFVAAFFGAKKLGATRWGMTGAVLGGLIGLFAGPVGILLGPFIGAFSLEWFAGREWREAAKAGAGATLGLFVGAVGKLACATGMVLLFVVGLLGAGR